MSLSLRERGLKCVPGHQAGDYLGVALLARAWIEMARRENNWLLGFVALLARAWIEIATKRIYMVRVYVALLARAWIEM